MDLEVGALAKLHKHHRHRALGAEVVRSQTGARDTRELLLRVVPEQMFVLVLLAIIVLSTTLILT